MTNENTELPIEVVNGGPNDPFAAKPEGSSPNGGAPAAQAGDAPATTATQADKSPQPVKDAKSVEDDKVSRSELEKLVAAAKAAQSAADKQANLLREQLKTAQAERTRIERESKLANEELTDSEKELLRGKWELEDERALIDEEREENDKFFRTIYIARSLTTAEKFGVTAEQLEACEEPEEMDMVCLKAEAEYYRSGKHLTLAEALAATPAAGDKAPAEDTSKVPAGAQAPTDLGGGAIVEPPAGIAQGTGVESMMASLKAIPAVSYKFN